MQFNIGDLVTVKLWYGKEIHGTVEAYEVETDEEPEFFVEYYVGGDLDGEWFNASQITLR